MSDDEYMRGGNQMNKDYPSYMDYPNWQIVDQQPKVMTPREELEKLRIENQLLKELIRSKL